MPRATWNGTTIAESEDTVVVEGNHYFPPESVDRSLLEPSDRTTLCPWKGKARYYDLVVDGKVNSAAAWYYRDPRPKAEQVRDRIAFWGGVEVSD